MAEEIVDIEVTEAEQNFMQNIYHTKTVFQKVVLVMINPLIRSNDPKIGTYRLVSKEFKKIVDENFVQIQPRTLDGLREAAKSFVNVTSIDFQNFSFQEQFLPTRVAQLLHAQLEAVPDSLVELDLDLSGIIIDNQMLDNIFEPLPKLTKLQKLILRNQTSFFDLNNSVTVVLKNLKTLEQLSFIGNFQLDADNFFELSTLTNLTQLEIRKFGIFKISTISDEQVWEEFFSCFPKLVSFCLRMDETVYPETLVALNRFKHIKNVSTMIELQDNEDCLPVISQLSHLENLEIKFELFQELVDLNAPLLSHVQNLNVTSLDVKQCLLKPEDFQILFQLKNLQSLGVKCLDGVFQNNFQLLTNLTELKLDPFGPVINYISDLKQLKRLQIKNKDLNFGFYQLCFLSEFNHLTYLKFYGENLSATALQAFSNIPNLVEFQTRTNNVSEISGPSVKQLCEKASFRKLVLNNFLINENFINSICFCGSNVQKVRFEDCYVENKSEENLRIILGSLMRQNHIRGIGFHNYLRDQDNISQFELIPVENIEKLKNQMVYELFGVRIYEFENNP